MRHSLPWLPRHKRRIYRGSFIRSAQALRFVDESRDKTDAITAGRTLNGTYLSYGVPNTNIIDTISLDPNIGDSTVAMLKKVFEVDYGFTPRAPRQARVQRLLLYAANVNDVIKI